METIIKKQAMNPLLLREEVEFVINSPTTPSKNEAKDAISSKLNKSPEVIVIKKIHQKFGTEDTEVYAYVYNSKESLEKIEPKPKVKKENAAEAPAQEKKK